MCTAYDELNISADEKSEIDAVLHPGGDALFLTQALDSQFRFDDGYDTDEDGVAVFDGKTIIIPANIMTTLGKVTASVERNGNDTDLGEWTVKSVDRGEGNIFRKAADTITRKKKDDPSDVSGFAVTYESKEAKKYEYQPGDVVTITVIPITKSEDEQKISPEVRYTFSFKASSTKKAKFFDSIKFDEI